MNDDIEDVATVAFNILADHSWRAVRITVPDAWKREKPEPGALLERELERRSDREDR